MDSLPWLATLCQGWRRSQQKTFLALWPAFVSTCSCILNVIARELTEQTAVGVEHTLKRLSRFLANTHVDRRRFYQNVILYVWPRVQHWREVPVAIDWTYCEEHAPRQSLVASLVVRGRGIPRLVWSFPRNDFLSYRSQSAVEDAFVAELASLLPKGQRLVILADRGYARASFFQGLQRHGLDFVIRVRRQVHLTLDGRLDTCATGIGLRLISRHLRYLVYVDLVGRLPRPT